MLKSSIDHLVITACSREAGVAHVAEALGVSPQTGGEHPRMGTHNALLRLGNAMYVEVIAANPWAPVPPRPRWFDLDQLTPSAPPRLATWVVCSNDIHAAVARSPIPLGPVEAMARDSLSWLITIMSDGSLPMEGSAPSVIQWLTAVHPAATLNESGCALVGLEVRHPEPVILANLLKQIGFDGPVVTAAPSIGQRPGLLARIQTPHGIRVLGEP